MKAIKHAVPKAASVAPQSAELPTSRTTPRPNAPATFDAQLDVLAAWLAAPTTEGEHEVAQHFANVLAEAAGSAAAVGLRDDTTGAWVYRRVLPAGFRDGPKVVGRVFPEFAREVSVPAGARAALFLSLGDHDAPEDAANLLAQVASAVERSLEAARTHEQAHALKHELEAVRQHMVDADKLASLGQLAAGVVHELNNPLTSILTYSDLMLRKHVKLESDPQDIERLRRIGESAERMLRFTKDLVTYARPTRESHGPLAIHAVMDRAVAFCEHVVDAVGALVVRQYATELPDITGMPEQLVQVFVNLITNACHATSGHAGRITLRTALRGQDVEVLVEDNGSGIERAHLHQIFLPFFSTKGEGRGTGLGLSIVKNIVENHGATITVASPTIDGPIPHGTRFRMLFRAFA